MADPGASPPGLGAQVGATKDAVMRLVRSHVDLAKAEFSEIADELKRLAALGGIAFGLLLTAALLLSVGGILFIGEWLFGSIGWSALLGALLCIDIAIVLVVLALGIGAGGIGASFIVAAIVGVVVGVVLGLNLTNRGWTALADALNPAIVPEWRILAVAVGFTAAILGILFAILGLVRGGVGGLVGGLIGGVILGALLGALTAITFSPNVAAAIGTLVALVVWPALVGMRVASEGVDGEALKARFYPSQTIETTKETIEWVREQRPRKPKS